MFGRIKLHPFIKANPPHAACAPATKALLHMYEGQLPAALLELWRKHGLGFYGRRQICLIDPQAWQSMLDRWIVSPPSATVRVPIALTPFGTLLFYRKLTAADEDVAALNPVTRSISILSWDLVDLFNNVLSDPSQIDEFIQPAMLETAQQQAGTLAPGEAYHVDPMLLSMQMLKIARTDALALHQKLRAQVDHEQAPPAPPPDSIRAALPDKYRAAFKDLERKDGHPSGIYLSTYIDWRRLVALDADGYQLLFWKNDHKTGEASDIRHYSGQYRVLETEEGDCLLQLDLVFTGKSLGSDANDDGLYLMRSGGQPLLLQAARLEDMATAIGGSAATMGSSEHYFRPVRLDDPFPVEDSDGMDAPPFADLPVALQALVHREPLRATIVEVAANSDPEDDTVMVWVDLGSNDGLRKNMPLMSPQGSPRALYGWVWRMDRERCGVGIKVRRDAAGAIVNGPETGDVLVSRAD
ncbi:GAD-like domain-containing protein [Variovorax paradoxus]|uniref:GAD-like domain-containing protein n=1 Tax=Variovorax paradoxus TaxID=34073 RepID=UPI003D659221